MHHYVTIILVENGLNINIIVYLNNFRDDLSSSEIYVTAVLVTFIKLLFYDLLRSIRCSLFIFISLQNRKVKLGRL